MDTETQILKLSTRIEGAAHRVRAARNGFDPMEADPALAAEELREALQTLEDVVSKLHKIRNRLIK